MQIQIIFKKTLFFMIFQQKKINDGIVNLHKRKQSPILSFIFLPKKMKGENKILKIKQNNNN